MSEPTLIQQERELLRAFRQAMAQRASATAEAAARLGREQKEVEVERRKCNEAEEQLRNVREEFDEARKLLEKGKWHQVLTQTTAFPSPSQQGSEPGADETTTAIDALYSGSTIALTPSKPVSVLSKELSACISQAHKAFTELKDALVDEDGTVREIASLHAGHWVLSVSFGAIFGIVAWGIIYNLLRRPETISETSGLLPWSIIGAVMASILVWWLNQLSNIRKRKLYALLYQSLLQPVNDIEYWRPRWLKQNQDGQQRLLAEANVHYRQTMSDTAQTFMIRMEQLHKGLAELTAQANPLSLPWQELAWTDRAFAATSPPATHLGQLQAGDQQDRFGLPAFLHLIGGRSLLFKASGAAKNTAIQSIQSLMLRLLAMIPPGKLRFLLIDPVGLGQNVAPFMHLADYDEALVTGKAWSEPQHIEQRLADLTEHMETVIQKYLRNQFATIEDYNAQAGEVAEPYRMLVVLDFPANFNEAAARRLVSIAQNGPRCGVYAIVLVDTARPLPYGFSTAELERAATVIAWDDQRLVWQDEDFKDCQLELDTPPDPNLFNRILQSVGEVAKETNKVEVPFERVAPPPAQWWLAEARTGLSVPLGPAGARKLQQIDLGQGTAQHALVVGKTGSGKSTLLHTLITNLALAYSPDEVELYLVDFKKGVEFKTYAVHQLPHARVVAIESEREFGLSVLQGLDAELKRRGDLFRSAGVDSLADYRQHTGRPMPRILLLVDEFQEFFSEDDTVASQSSQILDRLVRQGRAFGIHVLLGSQTLAGAYSLARSTIDQMAVRIALQCSEADSRLILADDNPAARLLSRPGEAIYNAANGLVEGNNPFQVAWLPDEERDRYLERIQTLAQEHGYQPPQPQIVFEGNAPGEVEKNLVLHDLLASATWPAPSRAVRAWLGEPITIREPLATTFRRQSGSNLLVVGQSDEAALGMMAVALISLAAQFPPPVEGREIESPFFVLDFGAADAPHADFFNRMVSYLPKPPSIGRRRQLPDTICKLAAEVQRRMDADDMATSPLYLFLFGLQRARDLRQEEGFGFSALGSEEPAAPDLAQQFATILREGPDVGVHALVWCDTLTNLNCSLDRRTLREFTMRAVFQMSAEDSANLIDTPAASKLGPYRALFYSEEEGRLEKFRPYALPSNAWLAWVGGQLRDKETH